MAIPFSSARRSRHTAQLPGHGHAKVILRRGRGDDLCIDRQLRGFVHVNGFSENFILLEEIRVEVFGTVESLPGE
jgi:hypothetical protein